MKVGFQNLSFKGVISVGSTPRKDKNVFDKVGIRINEAKSIAKSLKNGGQDVYVVKASYLDARGKETNKLNTYVLTGDDAKVVNKFDEIKAQLTNLFETSGHSDLFGNYLNRQIDEITKNQVKTAQFIAENKAKLENLN